MRLFAFPMSLLCLSSPIFLLCYFLVSVHAAQPFWAEYAPFAVRTPYLNAWHYPFAGSTNDFPIFWNGGVRRHSTPESCVILNNGTIELRVDMLHSG